MEKGWDTDPLKYADFVSGEVTYQSPLTPAELLAALHNIDDKVDMKTTIKGTNIEKEFCFRNNTT